MVAMVIVGAQLLESDTVPPGLKFLLGAPEDEKLMQDPVMLPPGDVSKSPVRVAQPRG